MSNHRGLASPPGKSAKVRNAIEYLAIIGIWWLVQILILQSGLGKIWLAVIILLVGWGKTAFFGMENLQQLWRASHENIAYHRFMLLMLINMSQIILSFGLDYHCLQCVDPNSFGSIDASLSTPEIMFDCTYFSVLNFTFFGYGDIMPQTIPAKLLTITEIVLAFVTVIFLLSDFISLKESIRTGGMGETSRPAGKETSNSLE